MIKESVLFICIHNSAQSQMAEGIFRNCYGDKCDVCSAGSDPQRIHPVSIQVMAEIGIDASKHRSKSLKEFEGHEMDYVVTVCDDGQVNAQFFTDGRKYIHQSFEDPSSFIELKKRKLSSLVRDDLRNS